jgi:prevent-host-death family protein
MVTSTQQKKIAKAGKTPTSYETGSEAQGGVVREIPAGEFKAKCLAIMDEVQQRGGAYVITKRGVPVAKLVPARIERRPLLGSMKGTVVTRGDLVTPLDEPWNALEGWDDER